VSELHQLRNQLKEAEERIRQLADRVIMYRYRWLEEYYRADNLEHHMPGGVNVPDLAQIPQGTLSPNLYPEYVVGNGM
jgi:hypothetical protein